MGDLALCHPGFDGAVAFVADTPLPKFFTCCTQVWPAFRFRAITTWSKFLQSDAAVLRLSSFPTWSTGYMPPSNAWLTHILSETVASSSR